ncbi:cobyrinate a,c-diamide synthase [Nocardia cyriacigeorgica]|uniref:Hydrogenobyrinate a,c-diamide synthase n=1 Tax=Nocardia cyriacigeorgica TaxID=135487 RepID=A0ABX0CEN3_9NOCA|nr:cobyrinate a,c-diamide synthase [Nocardia cyriacigeorgica]NEW39279.1 cobyrinate a,c-diamide synthase [Nocardia cyriacigeorgica]NEW49784.1 cobyrinate a,c-diamide synthase [Nocardia cyriacigeorgica]NEW54519.1 cobyrinate a,c-diamide synthase [Nocardia cyriacigeorgica]
MSVPAVVIAAPASGSGKTTVATGLVGALRRAGHRVAPFKVGPDYIDPGYHGLAAGRPGRNLDPVLCGVDRVVPLYRHGAAGCDLAVVEGVMGLFDGRIDADDAHPVAEGSTAQVAGLLGAPVVLVVDARGHSQSLAALLHGFATYDSSIRLGGVILNRVGSERHEQVLRSACDRVGLPVLGCLPRMPELEVPSRHLGLIPAVEHGAAATAAVAAMTDLVAAHVDLRAIASLAASATNGPDWSPESALYAPESSAAGREFDLAGASEPRSGADSADTGSGAEGRSTRGGAVRDTGADRQLAGSPDAAIGIANSGGHERATGAAPLIAMAGGAAFTFGYAEHRELLIAAGARVAVFDPLYDELPTGTAGLVLPGGFPEEHAADLAANTPLLAEVASAARRGMPIHAECAGLLYLTRSLDGHPMAGVLDATAEFGPRLTLGYRDAVALVDSPLWRVGERVRGHEFHRTRLTSTGTEPAWGWHTAGERLREGAVIHRVHASYLHTHPAGNPESVGRFVSAATDFIRTDAAD